ncbi:hypothetical protein [Streptomyces sp. NPDC059783]|uniref:hypothetical protein n=1 Tax=Streptomyces sp. NPDC059783 TaxID=3346944 RepID=UPI00364B1916
MVPADPGGGLMRTDLLLTPVTGLDEALAAVDGFDEALVSGLLRPRPDRAAGLAAFAGALAGTPLATRTAEATARTAEGSSGEDDYLALAGARTALLGSVHDALTERITEATGRGPAEATSPAGTGTPPPANLLAAARSWLADLARAGWTGLDHDTIAASAPVVSALLPDPSLRRLATLIDGFAAELAATGPGTAADRVPARRWADLWARAMLLTVPGAVTAPATETVTGRLLPLGVDLHEHPTAVQAQVHAVLEPADGSTPRLVRAAASAPKPDTVVGAGLWQLLRPRMSLLAALGDGLSMDLDAMPVTAEGDLIWSDGHARAGQPADPFVTARVVLPTAADAFTAPLDRHPVRIAVPVFLEGYTAHQEDDGLVFTVAGQPLAVDTDRVPAAGPLTPEAVAASGACLALLRWDAGAYRLQPLAVEATVRKKTVVLHGGAWAGGTTDKAGARAEKAATDAVAVLRERAGRLLRK